MIAAFYEDKKYRVSKESSNCIGISTACPDKYCVYTNKTLIKVWTAEQDETASIFLINQSTVITNISIDNSTNSTITEDIEYYHYYSTNVNDSLKLKFSRLVHRETNNTFTVTTRISSITLLGNFNITTTFKNNDGIISQQYNKYTNGTVSYTDEKGSFPSGIYGYYSVDSTKRVDYSSLKVKCADLESASADLSWVKPAHASIFTWNLLVLLLL